MKAFKLFPFIAFFLAISAISYGQVKTESFKVSGNCGMCKAKIEKAAKAAGATSATWDEETKQIVVKYNSTSTNTAKIQKKIAGAGYDNAGATATESAYKALHGCCQYERTSTNSSAAKTSCCSDDDKAGKDCCKDGKCTKEGHESADCCKDGKCTKEGHSGTDCCKKS